MATVTDTDSLIVLRRDLHRRPEPAWCEFYTTARIVEACREVGVDALHVGPDALASDERMAVPDDETLAEWYDRALEAGADESILAELEGGHTGLIAELHRGEGPTIALRVDIDGLPRGESSDPDHEPAAEGFRSENDGAMHACGHDAHAAIGVGVLQRIADSDAFSGTLKVLFQPAEEQVGGAKAMAESGHLDDVDSLLAIHIGLDHPTGEIVAGVEGFLAVAQLQAEFEGAPAHAGGQPEEGRNANQALAAAIQNLYAIPRHSDGPTRVNAGVVEGGTASNIIPEYARLVAEVRGETTPLMEYMDERAREVLDGAATMHDCDLTITDDGRAPSAESDDELRAIVGDVAKTHPDVERVLDRDDLGGSEDATYLMREVQDNGGLAAYVGVGTDHPGGHHTATFDVDENSIEIGVDVLAKAIERIAAESP
ncbi:M20 family metallo-hydrolase [Salinarchaeum chitinilyticum]